MDQPETIDQFTIDLLRNADPGQEVFVHVHRAAGRPITIRPWLPCHRLDNGRSSLLYLGPYLETLDGWKRKFSHRDGGWISVSEFDPAATFVDDLGTAIHGDTRWFERRTL